MASQNENRERLFKAKMAKGGAPMLAPPMPGPTLGDRARLFAEGVGRRIEPIGDAIYESTLGALNNDLAASARGKIMGAPPLPISADPNEIVVTAPRRTFGQRAETFGRDLLSGAQIAPEALRAIQPAAEAAAPHLPFILDRAKQDFARAATYGPAVDAYSSFQAGDEAFRRGDEQSAGNAYADAGGQGLMFAANALGLGAEVAAARLPLTMAQAGKSVLGSGPGWRVGGALEEAAEFSGIAKLPPLEMPEAFAPTPPRTDVGMSERAMARAANVIDESPADQFTTADRAGIGTRPLTGYRNADAILKENGLGDLAGKRAEAWTNGDWNRARATLGPDDMGEVEAALVRRFEVEGMGDGRARGGPAEGPMDDYRPTSDPAARSQFPAAPTADKAGASPMSAADVARQRWGLNPDAAPPAPRRFEAGFASIESPYQGRAAVGVEKNPSQAVIGKMVRESNAQAGGAGGVKWAVDPDGNLYAWNGMEANHDEIAAGLGLDWTAGSRGTIERGEQIGDALRSARAARGAPSIPPLSLSSTETLLGVGALGAAGAADAMDDEQGVSPFALAPAAILGGIGARRLAKGPVGEAASVEVNLPKAGTLQQFDEAGGGAQSGNVNLPKIGQKHGFDWRELVWDANDGKTYQEMAGSVADAAEQAGSAFEVKYPEQWVRSNVRALRTALQGKDLAKVAKEAGIDEDELRIFVSGRVERRSQIGEARRLIDKGITDKADLRARIAGQFPEANAETVASTVNTALAGKFGRGERASNSAKEQIIELRKQGLPFSDIAAQTGQSRSQVSGVIKRAKDSGMDIPSILGPAAAAAGFGAAAIGAPTEAQADEAYSDDDLGYEITIRPDADYSDGQWQRQRMQRVPLPDGSEGIIVPWRKKETGEERLVLRALENGVPADILGEVAPSGDGPIRPSWPDDGEEQLAPNYPSGRAPPLDLIPLDARPDVGNQGAVAGAGVGFLARLATMRGLRGAQGVNIGGLVIGPTLGAMAGGGLQLAQDADAGDVIRGTIGGAIGGSGGSIGADLARVGARDLAIPALAFAGDKIGDAIRYKQLFPQPRGPRPGMFEGASQQDVADALFQFEDARNARSLASNPETAFRDGKIPPLLPDTSMWPPYEYDKWPKPPKPSTGGRRGGASGPGGDASNPSGPERPPRTPREPMDPAVLARMERAAATGLKGKSVGDLRAAGEALGVPGATTMRKDDLVKEVAKRMAADGQRSNRLLRRAGLAFGLTGAAVIPALEAPTDSAPAPF